jgi:nucleotide-binding universal stress UspA family protein
MAYTKIVTAYDGSEPSIRALNAAMELAEACHASLDVVHVYQMPVVVMGEAIMTPPAAASMNALKEAENRAEEIRSIIHARSLRGEVSVVQGEPGKAIIDEAKEIGADMIVIGSRGLSGMKELFLGSVSHYVAQHAGVAVHIVK